MALGISGLGITGTLGDANAAAETSIMKKNETRFSELIKEMQNKTALGITEDNHIGTGVSGSQISKNHRLQGDYTQGFSDAFTSKADKNARPRGFASNARTRDGKTPTIDRTSDLYVQSMELENYMVKSMLSSMRNTIQHTSLTEGNDFARKMYDDMMYDNMAESLTKNSGFGLADQIYIELSGQK